MSPEDQARLNDPRNRHASGCGEWGGPPSTYEQAIKSMADSKTGDEGDRLAGRLLMLALGTVIAVFLAINIWRGLSGEGWNW